MRPCPKRFTFLCGAHFDQVMRLVEEPVAGVSNPARIEAYPGGAALNSASVAASLRLDVTLVSPVGNDANGEHLGKICLERGITPKLVTSRELPTGIYSALFDPSGNIIIGAADLAVYDAITPAWLEENLPHCDGLFVNANLHGQQLRTACSRAGFVAAATISPAKARRLLPILGSIDLLVTNLVEARTLVGKDLPPENLAEWFHDQGIPAGTISNGAEPLHHWFGGKAGSILPEPVINLVDVNGAGDALAGGLLAGLGTGLPFEEAVKLGLAAARRTLTRKGPYDPSMTRDNLKELT